MWLSPDAPTPYVGGLIGATVVLTCVSVAVIWWRRKKRAKASALRRVAKAEARRRAQLEVVVDMRLPGVEPQTWTPLGHYRTRRAPTPPRLSRVEETNEQRESRQSAAGEVRTTAQLMAQWEQEALSSLAALPPAVCDSPTPPPSPPSSPSTVQVRVDPPIFYGVRV